MEVFILSKTKVYGSSEIAKDLQITLRQLNHWVDDLLVAEPVLKQYGQRQYRRFSRLDFMRLQKMKQLVDQGYMPRAAAEMIKWPSQDEVLIKGE